MQYLNPFNLIVHIVFFLYNIYGIILTNIFKLWMILAMGMMIWFVVAIFMPSIDYLDHITMLLNMIVVNPPIYLFEILHGFADTIRTGYLIPESNAIKSTFFMLSWLAIIGLSLVTMPLIWFGWVIFTYFGFLMMLTGEAQLMFIAASRGANGTASGRNLGHLFMGRTSYKDVYDADVKANAIVEALEKKK